MQYGDHSAGEIFEAYGIAAGLFDVFNHYKVDSFLSALGLCVNSDYKGRGIATELLRARVQVLKTLGLSVASSSFSSMGAQTAAKKAGYDELFAISYEDLHNLLPQFDFSLRNTEFFKVSGLKI